MIHRDRLFKELLTTFFVEFIELFLLEILVPLRGSQKSKVKINVYFQKTYQTAWGAVRSLSEVSGVR
jgi:hypothetical protein